MVTSPQQIMCCVATVTHHFLRENRKWYDEDKYFFGVEKTLKYQYILFQPAYSMIIVDAESVVVGFIDESRCQWLCCLCVEL